MSDVSTERSNKLPDEIIGSHEARADFLKWKLILVAALGAAGFGLDEKLHLAHAHLFLALIPFVCIYVDLLCTNLKLRVIVIGTFYADLRQDIYERYTQRNRSIFQTEDWALDLSTYGLCLLLALIGLFSQTFEKMSLEWPHKEGLILIVTGLIGVGLYRLVAVKLKVSKELVYLMYAVCSMVALFGLVSAFFQTPDGEDKILFVAGLAGFEVALLMNCRANSLIQALTAQTDSDEVQNVKLGGLLRAEYKAEELKALWSFLTQKGVFIFKSLPNGLFSASGSAGAKDASGYQYVWVRDNIHVAHAHYVCGDKVSAVRNLTTLMTYFQEHQNRFQNIIEDQETEKKKKLATNPMNRPHIRFDGRELKEIKKKWGHAQNDALGYFLWCYCKLAREDAIHPGTGHFKYLINFLLYFEAIEYWKDEDSGHWEEVQKVSASSIGTVVAGLRQFELLLESNASWAASAATDYKLDPDRRKKLREAGETALKQILPCESIEPKECYRRFDGALLFLIYPLEAFTWEKDQELVQEILKDIKTHLQGDYGIRRYLGDSYWFPDYKQYMSKWKRTWDFSGSMEKRDAHIRLGDEAQWCIFDPIMSVIYGKLHLKYKKNGSPLKAAEFLQLQTAYFNRSLRQLTFKSKNEPGHRAPEAYYLENGDYVPNDHTPLLWTQANLWLAVNQMQQSVEQKS